MSGASTHVDPVSEPVKKRIGLEAVYEINALARLMFKHFVSMECEEIAFRGIALRVLELNKLLMPLLSDDDASGEEMAVAVFGEKTFWPDWVSLRADPE